MHFSENSVPWTVHAAHNEGNHVQCVPPWNTCRSAPVDIRYHSQSKDNGIDRRYTKSPLKEAVSGESQYSVEGIVVGCCLNILETSSARSLKAVELANTLRARIGTEMLAMVRENFGGLLSLLEKHVDLFRVERIAKNDKVSLWPSRIYGENAVCASDSFSNDDWQPATAGNMYNLCHQNHSSDSVGNFVDLRNVDGDAATSHCAVTRCLHVGNVPSSLSERQLSREFEKYGTLESIKLVAQRNSSRRFAFVTYTSIAEAVHAKQCLSKLHPWKSAISYAHRDLNTGSLHQLVTKDDRSPVGSVKWSSDLVGSGFTEPQTELSAGFVNHDSSDILTDLPVDRLKATAQPFVSSASTFRPHSMSPHLLAASECSDQSVDGVVADYPCPILTKLCDDTYVPTQPWQRDVLSDAPYCNAVVAQLQHFGGSTTISKLRGFLRGKLCAVDNIKSVPLKAMLSAYPAMFIVQNNFVALNPRFTGFVSDL